MKNPGFSGGKEILKTRAEINEKEMSLEQNQQNSKLVL